ncbi:hypothetical protein V866_006256 [Kwoniella sp. B9012]
MRLTDKLIISLLPILCLTPASTARKAKRGCKASSSLTNVMGANNLVAEPPITPTSSAITGLAVVQTSEVTSLTDDVIESTDSPVSSTYNAVPTSTTAVMFNNTMTRDSAATMTYGVSSNDPVSPTVSPTTSGTTNASVTTENKSRKAGVGWPVQEVDSAPVAQFFTSESAVAWWFNWNKNWNQGVMASDGVSIDGEFVPMIFGPTYLDNDDTFQQGFTELMGYNEPDLKSTTGVSVYFEPTVLRLMASNKTWLLEFFKSICPDDSASDGWGDCLYKPNYVSAHLRISDYLLVLSEFACYKFGEDPHPSLEEVSTFMQDTMEWLDQQDWVVKYAWFGNARNSEYLFGVYETNRLMDNSGALTELGKQYVNGGKPIS